MRQSQSWYQRHRLSVEIIQYAVCRDDRYNLSYRGIEDVLAERGMIASDEAIRYGCDTFSCPMQGK